MGRPKALVRDDAGEPWLVRGVRALREGGCDAVTVVLGAAADEAAPLLDGHRRRRRASPTTGPTGWAPRCAPGCRRSAPTSTSRRGRRWSTCPTSAPTVVRRLRGLGAGPASLARAAYDGVPGHPVLLGRDHWAGVLARRPATAAPATTWPPRDVDAGRVRRPRHRARRRHPLTCHFLLPDRADPSLLTIGSDRWAPDGTEVTVGLPTIGQRPGSSLAAWSPSLPATSPPASARPATCATSRWRPSPSSRCGCSGRCCSRASPAPARPRSPRRIAESLDLPLVRLQCYEGIDATQALYDWDFPRQILHLRALEARRRRADVEEAEKSLYDARFLLARPVLAALQQSPAVLLVDEVDRADDEFEAFLLEVLSTYQVTIPELGTVRAAHAADRGAHLQPHPRAARRAQAALPLPLDRPPRPGARGRDRPLPGARGVGASSAARSSRWCSSCATATTCRSRPGVAETLDWARALHHLGTDRARPRHRVGDARRAGEVPRGRRPGAAGPRPDAAA